MHRFSIQTRLFDLQDPSYHSFLCPLLPTVDPSRIIGVRMPALRKLAKELAGRGELVSFAEQLPHTYYEEDCLHGIWISSLKDCSQIVTELDRFLPHVDNWAVCDLIRPKAFSGHLNDILPKLQVWLERSDTYTVRFAVEMLMVHGLGAEFQTSFLDWVARLRREEYYIQMMVAWYFATALAFQPAAALPYLQQQQLDRWTHNKAIQKALESHRIPLEQKAYLRTLRR